jgi:hypothetical protein
VVDEEIISVRITPRPNANRRVTHAPTAANYVEYCAGVTISRFLSAIIEPTRLTKSEKCARLIIMSLFF